MPRAKPGLGHVRANLRPVGHDDTEREPDSPRRVPSDDVAHEMNAQVDPAEPDEQNEACKERNRRPAWKMGRGDTSRNKSRPLGNMRHRYPNRLRVHSQLGSRAKNTARTSCLPTTGAVNCAAWLTLPQAGEQWKPNKILLTYACKY